MKVGLGTFSNVAVRALMKARANEVLPQPRSPNRAITSPVAAVEEICFAIFIVAASSARSMVNDAFNLIFILIHLNRRRVIYCALGRYAAGYSGAAAGRRFYIDPTFV